MSDQPTSEFPIHSMRCCLLYPVECDFFFEHVVAPFLKNEFNLTCNILCYEKINRKIIQSIRDECKDSCILIYGYLGELKLEHSYKLGLVHAYNSRVILVSFYGGNFSRVPSYINYDFLMRIKTPVTEKDIDNFLIDISNIMISYLSEDIYDLLYKKAVFICEMLEQELSQKILRVDKISFSKRFAPEDLLECLNNYDKASEILLRKVVKDIKILSLVHLNEHAKFVFVSPKVIPDFLDNAIKQNHHTSNSSIDTTSGIYEDIIDIAKLLAARPIHNIAEANAMTNQPQEIKNFTGSMSGLIGSDNAQVSNSQFTQLNNANSAELLQLIANLRKTAGQFPKEIQEDIIIDIDDVEAEIQKPEGDRNLPKLKKRLLALATAGSLIAAPIAGMTDFANNATDLATKIGIELPIK